MQAAAPVHAFPYAYIGGWATLLYLALARRLPLRAHLLLIMPELAMQATACAAAAVCRHRSIGLPSSHPEGLFQARLSQLTPLGRLLSHLHAAHSLRSSLCVPPWEHRPATLPPSGPASGAASAAVCPLHTGSLHRPLMQGAGACHEASASASPCT